MSIPDSSPWFHSPFDRPADLEPAARLFCFPYAGAGPSAYHMFCKALPAHVLPFVAYLPGREGRRHQPALTDIHDIVGHLARAIRPLLGEEPAIFWGHSMGALVAFEIARMLGHGQQPRRLIVSGHKAPQLPPRRRPVPVEQMPSTQFINLLRGYGGMPQAVLDNPEVLELLLPQLRADFMAMDRYDYAGGDPLRCDILCINGESDRLVQTQSATAWREQTTGGFVCKWLPGAHFFIHESRPAFVGEVEQAVAQACAWREAEMSEGR